jgi:Trk-type K+ transport system membrane component
MVPEALLARVLFLFGIGFLAANVKVIADLLRFRVRKRSALLVWQNPKPPYYGFTLALGVLLGLLLAFKLLYQRRPPDQLFGEAMMFVYYGYVFPLSTRIARGFYRDGVWSDTGFMRWGQISAVSWKEEGTVTLVLISHFKNIARRLQVPGHLYGQARRLLRDRIKAHDIHIGGSGIDLGARDDQDAV